MLFADAGTQVYVDRIEGNVHRDLPEVDMYLPDSVTDDERYVPMPNKSICAWDETGRWTSRPNACPTHSIAAARCSTVVVRFRASRTCWIGKTCTSDGMTTNA